MMPRLTLKAAGLVTMMILAAGASADDLDIYAGATVSDSAPAELVFAIDTSSSMSCALDQNIATATSQCFVNLHPELLQDEAIAGLPALQGYQVPDNVKMNLVRNAMNTLLANEELLTDDVRVGLAFYNDPGGSIVQPLESLGAATGDIGYPDHRAMLRAEMDNVMPQGATPILGTLLEVGQYLTSGEVIAGKRRMARADLFSRRDTPGLTLNDYMGRIWSDYSESYGETARTSHTDTVKPETLNYSASPDDPLSAQACLAAVQADAVAGKADPACMFERLGNVVDDVFYNENVNRVSVCSANETLATERATTQVVLLSDGLATGEDMSFEMDGVSMATWVKRFVTGDASADGVLQPGAFDQNTEDFPVEAQFDNDVGCPESAHPNANTDDAAIRKAEFESCLYNVANRFRELDVKVNVIGFDVFDDNLEVDNNYLLKIAQITGGEFLSTDDVSDVEALVANLVEEGVEASNLSAALSPAVSVNPGAILSNDGDVFVPGFEAGTSSLFYGNLKKYQLDVIADPESGEQQTVLKGANGIATAECDISGSNEVYTCFDPSVRDLWTAPVTGDVTLDYSRVTVGGAAARQAEYGPLPDGGRKVFVQNGPQAQNLTKLNLVALDGENPDYGSPDESALLVSDAGTATKNYYARLVENPLNPGAVFSDFAALQTVYDQGETGVLSDAAAYNYLRWLNGFDQKRFNSDGLFSELGLLTERDLLEGKLLPVDDADRLKSRLFHGSVIHSVPVVVNYGFTRAEDGTFTYDNVVFVSGNDGFLRAVDADDGAEKFSFFPEALIGNIPDWYQNTPGNIRYGLDGSWTPWRQDLPDAEGNLDGQISDGNGFVRLYGGMRRGGSSYYFLDVTNLNAPRLLREISPADSDFSNMGQTWSQPVLARIKKPGQSLPSVVAVFGGGYDPDYDPDVRADNVPHCLDTAQQQNLCGNQIYMVEAGGYSGQPSDENAIGDLIWQATNSGVAVNYSQGVAMRAVVENMNHSIVSRVRTLDIDGDGLTDRIYVGDLGGQVFRIKINNNIGDADDPQNQFITIDTLAQVGLEGFNGLAEADNRMFYEAPSVAMMKNANQIYIGVAIASGWRANPSERVVNNELYFFRDTLSGNDTVIQRPTEGSTEDFIVDVENFEGTMAELDAASAVSASLHAEAFDGGEKAFGAPVILFGNVFVPVYVPPTSSENNQALSSCEPPPHRSAIVGFMVQSDVDITFTDNTGTITPTPVTAGTIAVFRSDAVRSVPFNGLGVHVGNDSVSILAGTKAITVPLPDEPLKKTRWQQMASGVSARPLGAFGTGAE